MHPLTEPQRMIILGLLGEGISVEMVLHGPNEAREVAYKVGGFYKSGTVTLVPGCGNQNEMFEAYTRYGEYLWIEDMEDLIALNHDWWARSRHRGGGWDAPDSNWLRLLTVAGLVKANTQTVTTYESA